MEIEEWMNNAHLQSIQTQRISAKEEEGKGWNRESDFVFYGAVWTCKQAGLEPDIKEQKGSR